jgi:hypothetical protein
MFGDLFIAFAAEKELALQLLRETLVRLMLSLVLGLSNEGKRPGARTILYRGPFDSHIVCSFPG